MPPSPVISPDPALRAAPEAVAGPHGHALARAPLLRLLRPRHWVKNAFVLAPTVFAGVFLEPASLLQALFGTALFCVASSAVYVLNDIRDVENDRLHPMKRLRRPLASGQVSMRQARVILAILWAVLLVAVPLRPTLLAVILGYVALNAAYSAKLKHVPVVDLFCVAAGFVLRVLAGAVAVSVPLSSWMLITTLCLALYLAAIKRRQELAGNGSSGRSVLDSYSVVLLDRYAEMSAVGAIIFYGLFVIEVRPALSITIPMVLFGLFRYWFIVESRGSGESPTDAVWKDLPLGLTVLAWGALALYTLWPA